MYFRVITSLWETREGDICLTLLQLKEAGYVTSQMSRPGYVACPAAWVAQIDQRIKTPGSSAEEIALLNAYCKLHGAIFFFSDASVLPQMTQSLHSLLSIALTDISPDTQLLRTFACGQGFKSYVDFAVRCNILDLTLWNSIISAATRYSRLPLFLESTLHFMSAFPNLATFDESIIGPFLRALVDNLAGPSHELRLLSLKLLCEIASFASNDHVSLISLAIQIEESPLTLQAARACSFVLASCFP
jgi:U3 small nucleolar RNA-associated protein 20